jgi:hypothetical protein
LLDLTDLNDRRDGAALAVWLANAVALSGGTPEAAAFEKALERLRGRETDRLDQGATASSLPADRPDPTSRTSVSPNLPEPPPPAKLSPSATTAVVIALCAAMIGVPLLLPRLPGGLVWCVEVSLVTAVLAVVGRAIAGRSAGVLIDEQKLFSLSRFQVLVWLVLVLSAYLTIILRRMHQLDPTAVAIDEHLLVMMGVSISSVAGARLLQSRKRNEEPLDGITRRTAAALGQSVAEIERYRSGLLYGNPSVLDASFADMFAGDEVDNVHYVDLGKVQLFVSTVTLALIYATSLFVCIDGTSPDATRFPSFTPVMLTILALSHAIYLGGMVGRSTRRP